MCYVLGANPPIMVIEGFFKRIWGRLGLVKVASMGRGLFMVKFDTMENRDKILNEGFHFFDGKPIIIQPWKADMNLLNKEIHKIPIWIELHNLELKYWGERSMSKIVSKVGKYIKVDQATLNRDRLQFAKVLVEVAIDQAFPDFIQFKNEHGEISDQQVAYRWKPIRCMSCQGYGHKKEKCVKKAQHKKIWVVKKMPGGNPGATHTPEEKTVPEVRIGGS